MNPASRILTVYDKAMAYNVGNGVQFLQLWGSVFGIAEKAEPSDEDAITACLMAFRDEISLAKTRLAEVGCPSGLYARYLDQVRGIASSTLLHQDWKGHRPSLNNDVRLALEWASWALPDEEDELPSEEVSDMLAELEALALALEQSGIPPLTRDFVARQIELIRSALRLYGIRGIAPVEKALEQSLGYSAMADSAAIAQEVEAASPEGKALLKRFGNAFGKVVHAADSADKLRKGAEALGSLGTVMNALTKFLPPG